MEFNKSNNVGSDTDQSDDSKAELLLQIASLQEAVSDMKIAITSAAEQLGTLQWDENNCLKKIDQNKNECQNQIAEVVKLILSLQTEFGSTKYHLQQLQEVQARNQHQLQGLMLDQDLLVEELRKTSSISEPFRQQFNYCRQLRTSTGSQSNDSGVALLLEKAQSGFHHFSFPTPSDNDSASIPETSPGVVSSMVQEYIAGLNQTVNANWDDDDARYDSDSSLVAAANKSLSLSTSLGKQCYLEFYHQDHSEDENHSEDCDVENISQENRNQNPQLLKSDAASFQALSGKNQMNILNKKQPYSSFSKPKPYVQDQHVRETHRLHLSKNIVEAERKYCKKLWILQDTYMEPLKEQGILSLKDFNTLFPEEIYRMYEKHCMLLHKLEERIQAWKWHSVIGDILLKFTDPEETDVLNLYTSYVNEFPEVLKTFYKLCKQSDRFTQFLKDSSKNSGGNTLDLTDFLLIPLQRIPKYVLFLKHILKFTPVDHSDYNNISICLNRLRDFLVRLNDSMEHSFQLITAQINSQSEYNSCLSPSINYPEKMSRNLKNRYRQMESQDLPPCDTSDEENSLQEELIQPNIKQNNTNCQEKEVVHYKKCNKVCKSKCGSQESLNHFKESKFYIGPLSPTSSYSSMITGSCREKIQSHPKSENFIIGSASCSDVFDTCKSNACKEFRSRSLSKMCIEEENCCHAACNESNNTSNHKLCIHNKHLACSVENCGRLHSDSNSGILHLVQEEEIIAEEKICEKFLSTNFSIVSSLSECQSLSSSSTSKSLQEFKEEMEHLKNITPTKTGDERNIQNFAELIKYNKCSRNYMEAGKKGNKKTDSHHSSNVDLATSKHLEEIRPLSKAHSSHAVMQMLKEQPNTDSSYETGEFDKKKGKCKSEKKRVSLRSLKNMFFKKRAYANIMKTMDIGTCTSHDEILSSDNLLKPTTITFDASA